MNRVRHVCENEEGITDDFQFLYATGLMMEETGGNTKLGMENNISCLYELSWGTLKYPRYFIHVKTQTHWQPPKYMVPIRLRTPDMGQKTEAREEGSDFKVKCSNKEKLSRGRGVIKCEGRANDFGGNTGEYGTGSTMVWMSVSFQNSYVEILMPSVMAWGGGAFGRDSGHEGGTIMNGTNVLIKLTSRSSLTLFTMWGHNEKSVTRKRALTQPCWQPDLGLAASRIVRNEFLVCKPPSLWYFVITAWMDQDRK